MTNNFYEAKQPDYFSTIRKDIVSVLPVNPGQKVLEIGAGACNTLLYLKEKGIAAEVMGVELMDLTGSNQRHPAIDKLQIADIEKEKIDAPDAYFDVIICADVFEHLSDPWSSLEKIIVHLKPGGIVVVSIPNIREIKTVYQLLVKGDFKYEIAGGILDKTHLRFFCKKNIRELLTTKELEPIYSTPNFLLKSVPAGRKRRIFNRLSFGLFEDLLTVQYIFIARKKQ